MVNNNIIQIALSLSTIIVLTACGGGGESSSNTVPIANSQSIILDEDSSKAITLTASDIDGDVLTYVVITPPTHGILTGVAPNLIYTPTADYFGIDNFSFHVNDGVDDSRVVKINITINDVAEGITRKTGQSTSYDKDGNEVADRSQRDDGYYQKGISPSYSRDDKKEIVTDNLTELMWQDDTTVSSLKKQWMTDINYNICHNDNQKSNCFDTLGNTASTYCTELVLGGYENWRLPSIGELEKLPNYGKKTSALDVIFKNVSSSSYWSSTTSKGDEDKAWIVDFDKGFVNGFNKNNNFYVRCVRSI